MRIFLAGLAVVVLGVSNGCGKLSELDQKVAGALQGKIKEKVEDKIQEKLDVPDRPIDPAPNLDAPLLPPSNPQEDADASLLKELNEYIACLNRAVPRAEDSYKRYLSWVDKKGGPTCQERYITYGLYTLYEDGMVKCRQAAEAGKAGGPALPDIEAAAGQLAACNEELVPLVKKASDYYNQQDYRDDACAKGKQMHPQLVTTFEKCFTAAQTLSQGVDKLKVDLDRRRLAKLDQAGASFEAEVMRVMVGAKDLLGVIKPDGTVAKDAYVPKCLEVEKTVQRLDDYAAAHKDEVDKVFWGSAFVSSVKTFNTAAKFLRRELEDGKDPRRQAEAFIDGYNRMVSDSNNLRF